MLARINSTDFYHVIRKSLVINAHRAVCSMEEDGLMEDAILYLQKKTYRVGLSKNEKRIIRRKAEKFSLETQSYCT